ncbi:MAG: glycosyltransferase family 39 protein, partial [Bacteroidota bacterium]|nr:glycosyltransferase family 39 protein [Bacteroidota bacterium]
MKPGNILARWSLLLLVILFGYSFCDIAYQGNWQRSQVIEWDSREYYQILPATFIHQDPGYGFLEELPKEEADRYWVHSSPSGKPIGRMSLGMGIMLAPLFLLAHILAPVFGYAADGFSPPYHLSVLLTGWMYALIGFIVLYKLLIRYFREGAVLMTIAFLYAGTNLYYYTTTEGGFTHAPLFGLFSVFLYCTVSWHESSKLKYAVWLAVAGGLIVLIRPTNIIIGLVFLAYGVYNKQTLKANIQLFKARWKHFAVMFIILLGIALPQLIYWKLQTGQWVYYSYTKEGFYFNDPHIIDGLFSWRKG